MEFKDRVAKYPGRIALKKVSTNATTGQEIYDVALADEATEQGTPLNKQTLDAFKEDIIDSVQGETGKERQSWCGFSVAGGFERLKRLFLWGLMQNYFCFAQTKCEKRVY